MENQKYKVLFVASDNSKSSGAFLCMIELAKLLMKDFGCEVHVLIPRKGNGIELLCDNGIPFHYVRAFNWIVSDSYKNTFYDKLKKTYKELLNWIAVLRCNEIIKKYNIEIIHINTSWTYIGALLAKKASVPFVWHIREFLEEDQNKQIWNKSYGYKLMAKANRIITVSKGVYDKYEKLLPPEKMQAIYDGVDKDRFYIKKELLFSNDKINVLITGRVSESKGQWQIIQAMKLLVDRGITNLHLDIVGKGNREYIELLKKFVDENALTQYVTFWGFRQDTEEFYRKADVACMCSRSEAFGRVTAEAMLSGTLVVGAAAGATLELISDEKTGLLYDYADIECLANKLLWISENRNAAKEIANAGQKYALENMTIDINAKNIYHVYEEILGKLLNERE